MHALLKTLGPDPGIVHRPWTLNPEPWTLAPLPGEQRRRNYDWDVPGIDPTTHRFGAVDKDDYREGVRKALQPELDVTQPVSGGAGMGGGQQGRCEGPGWGCSGVVWGGCWMTEQGVARSPESS